MQSRRKTGNVQPVCPGFFYTAAYSTPSYFPKAFHQGTARVILRGCRYRERAAVQWKAPEAAVLQFPCRKLPALRTFPIHDQICIYHAVIDPVPGGEGDLDAVQPVTFTMQGLGQKLPLLQGLCCIAALRRFDCFCPIVIKIYESCRYHNKDHQQDPEQFMCSLSHFFPYNPIISDGGRIIPFSGFRWVCTTVTTITLYGENECVKPFVSLVQ